MILLALRGSNLHIALLHNIIEAANFNAICQYVYYSNHYFCGSYNQHPHFHTISILILNKPPPCNCCLLHMDTGRITTV